PHNVPGTRLRQADFAGGGRGCLECRLLQGDADDWVEEAFNVGVLRSCWFRAEQDRISSSQIASAKRGRLSAPLKYPARPAARQRTCRGHIISVACGAP